MLHVIEGDIRRVNEMPVEKELKVVFLDLVHPASTLDEVLFVLEVQKLTLAVDFGLHVCIQVVIGDPGHKLMAKTDRKSVV